MGIKIKRFIKYILNKFRYYLNNEIENACIKSKIEVLLNEKYSDEEIVNIICDQYKLNYDYVYHLIADVKIKEHSLTTDSSITK